MKNVARTLIFAAAVSLSTMPSYAHMTGCNPHPWVSHSFVSTVLAFIGL